jgi:large subunit ribosomal protein L2
MGKRIISQARGKGSSTYRVSKRAFRYKLQYPRTINANGTVVKLFNSSAHSAPLAKIKMDKEAFIIPAYKGMCEGEAIEYTNTEIKEGKIMKLKDIPLKTQIYNIESRPGDGGKFIKSAGSYATVNRIVGNDVFVVFPSKKEKKFNKECRAVIGKIAGAGRYDKPIIKAGKKYHIKKSKSKLWPRTSAVKMNAIDHPFGSGRGKNPKPKIAKRNSPPGAKVGLIRPKKTGKRK